MSAAEPQLTVVEPIEEPIVLVVRDETLVIPVADERWPVALQLRETEHALKCAEQDLRGKRALITKLRKHNSDEDERARKARPDRELVERVFERWRVRTGHLRAKCGPERFDMITARLDEEYEGLDLLMAAEGLAADPPVFSGRREDDLKVCMKSGSQVERYANKCPAEVRKTLREEWDAERAADPQIALSV